jgi:hypothetical protein
MTAFNRAIATLVWIGLLLLAALLAISPFGTLDRLQGWLAGIAATLGRWQAANPTNFLIGQVAFGVLAVLVLAGLLWLEFVSTRRRGVRIYTAEGGSAELDTTSIGRRLAWHLDQLAEVVNVVPTVKSRGRSVDIKLEIEAAPDVDIPLKTDEVVQVTHEVVEVELGLKLGKLDVQMRCAPFEPNWAG